MKARLLGILSLAALLAAFVADSGLAAWGQR
jgi:hypothetical protein